MSKTRRRFLKFPKIYSKRRRRGYYSSRRRVRNGDVVQIQAPSSTWQLSLIWPEILEISDPYKRYLKMGRFVWNKALKKGYEALSDSEKIVYHAWLLESQVKNGGFDFYFHNSNWNHTSSTLEILRLIGSVETADLLEQAIRVVSEAQPPTEQEKLSEPFPSELKAKLDELYHRFFYLKEPIYRLVVNYIGNGSS